MTELPSPVRRAAGPRRSLHWTQDPEGVRRDILTVAGAEFAEKGLSGARVDDIAARTSTSKRMIYYYFGDKEGLYRAVLERSYAGIRAFEHSLDLAALDPVAAMATLTGATFDYHADNPDFVRLVMIENIHHARHLKTSSAIAALNVPVIDMIGAIYRRGRVDRLFRDGLDPIDIHLTISALSFYNVSNQASIAQVFGHDMTEPGIRARRRAQAIETIQRMLAR